MKKIMIAAPASGSGKTTVTLGLLQLLTDLGYDVQPYKVGPDYIDTSYHSRITQRTSKNLDMFLVPNRVTFKQLFEKQEPTADIAVIEGVMGLFDGLGSDMHNCSSAGVAKELNCPVILVIDGKAASTSIAALVEGFLHFDTAIDIVGVIVNNVASDNHFQLIKQAIERYSSIPVLGCLYRNPDFELPSRQLGLVPDGEIENVIEKVRLVADALSETLDVQELLSLAVFHETGGSTKLEEKQYRNVTIAYALDEAFHFYYQDNLDLLTARGVTLRHFSPMKDTELPEADLYYFGGGYPEEFAQELSDNIDMMQAIYRAHVADIPILAECGGLMYLGKALQTETAQYPMVGIFEGVSSMTASLKRFGYCYGLIETDCLVGDKGQQVRGHEFHHSQFETTETPVMTMKKERDGKTVAEWQGGYQKRQTFASYLHLHFLQDKYFIDQLLKKLESEQING